MMVRDNHGRVVGQLEQFRDAQGNSVTANTLYYNERPVTQTISMRDNQGHVETRIIQNGRLLP